MTPRHSVYAILGIVILGCFTGPSRAQDRNFDPFADGLIAATSQYLASATQFSMHAEITVEEVLKSGHKIHLSRSADIMVRRPDRLRAELIDDKGRRRLFYDGETVSLHNLRHNVYATVDVPGTIEQMIDEVRERYGVAAPLADLLVSDPYANYRENAETATYLGLHTLQGVEHHHLLLSNQEIDYQIWIEDSAMPLPKKITVTYFNQPGLPQITAILTDWNFAPRLPDLVFEFAPPADADEIKFLPVNQDAN